MSTIEKQWQESYLFGSNAEFIEKLYDQYLTDPNLVNSKWQKYFANLQGNGAKDVVQSVIREKFAHIMQMPTVAVSALSTDANIDDTQAKVWQLVAAYRSLGVSYADLNPLQTKTCPRPQELDIAHYGLANSAERKFYVDLDLAHSAQLSLSALVKQFDAIYCNKISFEFSQVLNDKERIWLNDYVESKYLQFTLNATEKIQALKLLLEANGFERYLHTKYVGQKRFSLEGGESLISALNHLFNVGIERNINEFYLGMAHRGRLNCLVNLAGKIPSKVFAEFEAKYHLDNFVLSSDVKYHKGYQCNYCTNKGQAKVSIINNPSHLESINPVLTGVVRARQDKVTTAENVLGVMIHGDAALIGLGTNQGVLSLSQTRGYTVHGTIHIVINNQIGFTASDSRDTRSSRYCTDIAKMVEMPVIHVNADDIESVIFAIDLAFNYRQQYHKDIMIDLLCFRRYGHNEADDPTLTQPYMYRLVKAHPGVHERYGEKLISEGIISSNEINQFAEEYRQSLGQGIHPRAATMQPLLWYDNFAIKPCLQAKIDDKVTTIISEDTIKQITSAITKLPNQDYVLHPTVSRLIEARNNMAVGIANVDFGMAETLAYGSLLLQGITVRLTGEDSMRGTFTHRQAVWHNYADNDTNADTNGFVPLQRLADKSKLHLYNSILNEECVLGFEYGYSLMSLRDLVIWEAQFGDFANGAQVIIDQYICSAEAKWGTLSNLTLLLPHGYDGMGPEHSSARMERYLQLCAENNMQIVIPSTAAQMFHILRYKALTNWLKPLVIFMSKRLLRYKDAMSPIAHFTNGGFKAIINDDAVESGKVERVIVCCGQVYYDLYQERINRKLEQQVAIIRLERLYPFPLELLISYLNKLNKARTFVWVQEEPHNQGAWLQIRDGLDAALNNRGANFIVASRPAAAATACGMSTLHNQELKDLLAAAFA